MMTTLQKLSIFLEKHSRSIIALLLVLLLLATSWSLFIPGIGVGHDLNHQARIYEMSLALREGVFPVIWSQHLGYGVGMPLFEFYAPLPYYFGSFWHLLGLNLTLSVEMIILTANLITIVGAYLLGKELFNNAWAGVTNAAVLVMAPYRAVDLFVRAALSEGWAIAWLTMVLWGIVLIVKNKRWGIPVTALSFAALVLSHNLTALLSIPFLIVFGLAYVTIIHREKKIIFSKVAALCMAGVLALGISAFYFIPALMEKDFTQVEKYTVGNYYDYRQHFLYLRQFVEPWGKWEFGGSGWGPNDEMSFFLGYGQLLVITLSLLIPIIIIIKRKKKLSNTLNLHILFLGSTAVALALTLLKSQKIWELFDFAAYFQFPWRLLAIAVVFIGLLASSTLSLLPKKFQALYLVGMFLLVFINISYFRSEKYFIDAHKFSTYEQVVLTDASSNLFDYLPKDINFLVQMGHYVYPNPSFSKDISLPITTLFYSSVDTYTPTIISDQSTKKVFTISLPEATQIDLNIAYYPGWTAMKGNEHITVRPNDIGLLSFNLPAGDHQIVVELKDTPIRYWSKIVSVGSLLLTGVLIFLNKKIKASFKYMFSSQ